MPPLLLVAVGGSAGACTRYGLGLLAPDGPGGLPLATLLTNLVGCLLLGLLVGRRPDDVVLRPLLGTGFLGGFTTMSALALEADRLLVDRPQVALGYLALSTVGGLLCVAAGLRLGRRPA